MPRTSVSANLAVRLIQLHLLVIYGMAGLGKLQGPSWWNGMALWGTMTAGEFVVLDFTPMARWPVLINLLTHASLALELLYPILIWIRIARPLILLGVASLHLGIAAMSPGLTEFALAMLAANLAFVPGSWLRRMVADPGRPPLRVLFDGACPRCRSTLALVTAADPFGRDPTDRPDRGQRPPGPSRPVARVVPAGDARRSTIAGGFRPDSAPVRAIAGRLPLAWPLSAIAFLPGVASLGRFVYNRVAATRPREVPCRDATCGSIPGRHDPCLASSAITFRSYLTRFRPRPTPKRCPVHE